jgi:hypothetical protein
VVTRQHATGKLAKEREQEGDKVKLAPSARQSCALATTLGLSTLNAPASAPIALKSYSYRAVRTLIETRAPSATAPSLDVAHDNLRGPEYFQ